MEQVLVTGGSGLLGYHVVNQAINAGYQVKAMVRPGSNTSFLTSLKCKLFYGQISSKEDIFKAVRGCQYVIHAAAKTSQTGKPEAFYPVNVDSTKYLIQACKAYKIKRMVFVSSANTFTNGSMSHPGNEDSGFMPWLKNSAYAKSKMVAQNMVLEACRNGSLDAIVVVPTLMVGSHDVKPSSGKILLNGLKTIAFYPAGGKSFVDVEHAANASVNGLKKGRSGECYLLSGKNMYYGEFFKLAGQVSGKKQLLIKVPQFLLKLAGIIGDILTKAGIGVSFNSTNIRVLCLDNFFSNHKAMHELDMKETDIKTAIGKAITWFKANDYI